MWYFVAKHYSVIQKNIPFPHFCTFCAFYFLSSFFVFVAVFWIPFSNFHTIYILGHLGNVSGMVEPFFRYFPFFYVDDPGLRDFMEKRFIRRWRPQLNAYNVAY